ncbi:MAG: SLBB domain-containing protein [Chitinophagaceae bacterium]|nr:SLBB domain-containing protein [Chitinophagaceae bacterium]
MCPKHRCIGKNLFLLISLFLFAGNIFAQSDLLKATDLSNVNIDNFSDSQIGELLNKASQSGYSIQDLTQLLSQKGMPASQINKLKERVSDLSAKRGSLSEEGLANNVSGSNRFDSTLGKIPLEKTPADNSIFGSELFSTTSLVFEPNLRIPAPPDYVLGPDDQIVITVYGYSEKRYEPTVNELGEIYIPNVGPVFVNGLTLDQASEKIKARLASTIYSAIKSGQTKVQVTLGKIRSIRVTVIGQAKKPGTYTVSSLTTLYNILYLCGGPTDMGSYRKIEVIRRDGKRTADLYDFLVYGNQKDNILLQEGDVVFIPYYLNRVIISGNIKRQGKYEMLPGETFSNLLNYTGGFTDIAYRGAVTVSRITDSNRIIVDVPASRFTSFQTQGSDDYTVGKLQDEFGNRIYITGAVQRPGPYEYSSGITLKDLINKAGGLKADAFTKRALIYKYLPNKLPAIESVNIDSVLNGTRPYNLQRNDSVIVNSIFEFYDNNFVETEGDLRAPQKIQWRKNLSLNDVIIASGGISESGDSSLITISRRIQNVDVGAEGHSESKIINVDLALPGQGNILLNPNDIIIVRKKPGYITQRTIIVQGEVLQTGKFALANSNTKVDDIISQTGGFKSSADSSTLIIRRISNANLSTRQRRDLLEKVLNLSQDSINRNPDLLKELNKQFDVITVNLKNAISDPGSSDNLILENGDILTIPRSTNLIRVSGEVYFPTLVPYLNGKNLKYYVEQSGNFTPQSRKSSAMVIQPDGRMKSVKHFLFFKSYPKVAPESEILVPRKSDRNKERLTVGEISVVLSSLAIIANLIYTIGK